MDKKLKIFTIFAFTKAWLISILCLVSLEISHASPIEFWLTGQESFNNKEECSIYPVCFCQTIDPSDTLRLDIRDSTDGTNYLVIYLDDGSIWDVLTFAPTGFDHHQYLLIIGENGDWNDVEDRKLIFKISNGSGTLSLLAPSSFTDVFGTWDTKDATTFAKNGIGLGGGSVVNSYQNLSIPSGATIKITYNIFISGFSSFGDPTNGFLFQFYLTDSGGVQIDQTITYSTGNGIYNGNGLRTIVQIITANANTSQLHVRLDKFGCGGNASMTYTPTIIYYPDSSILAFSDCVEITSNQDFICTKLISYSNSTDIAGLGFPSWSPPAIYYLRIPAVFFEEQFPQEQEDLELSTDEIITLWSKMEAKKLLDIGFMPFYMHKKVQLILMMDYISIDGIEYRKRDPYTISEGGSKRHALRRAQVLLSEKDFITRNLL